MKSVGRTIHLFTYQSMLTWNNGTNKLDCGGLLSPKFFRTLPGQYVDTIDAYDLVN